MPPERSIPSLHAISHAKLLKYHSHHLSIADLEYVSEAARSLKSCRQRKLELETIFPKEISQKIEVEIYRMSEDKKTCKSSYWITPHCGSSPDEGQREDLDQQETEPKLLVIEYSARIIHNSLGPSKRESLVVNYRSINGTVRCQTQYEFSANNYYDDDYDDDDHAVSVSAGDAFAALSNDLKAADYLLSSSPEEEQTYLQEAEAFQKWVAEVSTGSGRVDVKINQQTERGLEETAALLWVIKTFVGLLAGRKYPLGGYYDQTPLSSLIIAEVAFDQKKSSGA